MHLYVQEYWARVLVKSGAAPVVTNTIATKFISDTLKNLIPVCNKRHITANVIRVKHSKVTNIIIRQTSQPTNVICDKRN